MKTVASVHRFGTREVHRVTLEDLRTEVNQFPRNKEQLK